MTNIKHSRGIAHIAAFLVVIVAVLIGATGYAVVTANQSKKTSNTPAPAKTTPAKSTSTSLTKKSGSNAAADAPKTDQDKVLAALKVYCQTEYKKVWEGSYNITIEPTTVTASYDDTIEDPGRIDGNYAVITAAKCDTPQLTEFQKFAPFKLYLQKTDDAWKAYVRTQSTPQCTKFDGKGWPSEILPQCLEDGAVRAPKQATT